MHFDHLVIAIYHLEAKVITRGTGRSAVAAAAYMSCSRIYNDYDGITHDYTRKRGLVGHSLEDADFSVLDAIDKHAEVICFYYDDEDERKKKIHMEQLAWKYKLISDKVLFAS